jgi:hypothetical protein
MVPLTEQALTQVVRLAHRLRSLSPHQRGFLFDVLHAQGENPAIVSALERHFSLATAQGRESQDADLDAGTLFPDRSRYEPNNPPTKEQPARVQELQAMLQSLRDRQASLTQEQLKIARELAAVDDACGLVVAILKQEFPSDPLPANLVRQSLERCASGEVDARLREVRAKGDSGIDALLDELEPAGKDRERTDLPA